MDAEIFLVGLDTPTSYKDRECSLPSTTERNASIENNSEKKKLAAYE